ncbi:MAG: hypothetical protein K6G10_10635, partial [Butyrivibrio sp.]|nr:hypothetical protein [Butyrivibrio sp.]
GEGKKPLAYIYSVKNKALKYGTDYTLVASASDDHKSAGTHHFTITGADGSTYIGSKTLTYSITGMSLKNAKVAGLITSAEYKGETLTLADLFNENDKIVKSQGYTGVTLYTAKKSGKSTVYNALTGVTDESDPEYDNADYLISMNNTGATGKFTLTFTGINKYSGQIKKTIKVNRYNIGEPKKAADKKQIKIYPEPLVARYAKGGIKIDGLTVMHGEKTLREGIDYKVSYKNSTTVTVDPVALIKLKASKRPTLVIKGIGNYTGTNASRYINIVKDSVKKHVELSVSDVVYNKKGKKGYFMPVPKLVDGGKNISVGRNKDVEPISAKDYEYFYTEETTLTDGRRRGAGDPVTPIDKVPAGTMIAVTVTVKCGEKSHYEQTDAAELTGYYKVIDKTYNISKAKVVVNKPSGLMFSNGNLVIPPLKDDDNAEGTNFTVAMKIGKNNVTLGYDDFEVVSVKNNKFLGTATVTIRGIGQYGGIKKFTYKISARNISR